MNGLVVLLLPLLARTLMAAHYDSVVHPPGWSPLLPALRTFFLTAIPMLPLATIAAWRTSVHAQRWRQGERDVVAIAEAIGCGTATALVVTLVVAPTARSLLASLPGMVIVGAFGAVIGAAVGLLLYVTAVVVLAVAGCATMPS